MRATILSLAFALAPAIAEACPACAGRDRGGVTTLLLLGSMIVLPFAAPAVYALVLIAEAAWRLTR